MNKLALLTLSALVLAACGGGQPQPSSALSTAANGGMSGTVRDNLSRFEDRVNADLATLERPGLAGQATAPYVYLNALLLPSSTTTVRAYFKTTAPSGTACSIAWGDSSSNTVVPASAVPTTARIDTFDHTYASGGSYTVTATCTALPAQSVTVLLPQAIDFETPALGATGFNAYDISSPFTQKGYSFAPLAPGFLLYAVGTNVYSAFLNAGVTSSQTIFSQYDSNGVPSATAMKRVGGGAFTLKSFKIGSLNQSSTTFQILGFNGATQVASYTTASVATTNPSLVVTLPAGWSNLTEVRFYNPVQNNAVLDDIFTVP